VKTYATDNDLVKACLNERAEAQRALYQKFARQMLGICMRYTQDKMEAEDTLQIGFMKVFDNLKKFEGGSLEGWMKRIFVRTAIDRFRQRQRDPIAKALEPEDYHAIALEDVVGQLSVEEILFAIGQLPEGCRMVFNLFAVEGYSHGEIADLLGISDGTSRSQFSRAKLLLKEKIFARYHG
jgi:RNA polymerase sigma factor (sigma-70 family)